MERIEAETEQHRFQKAIRNLVNQPHKQSNILFPRSNVLILAAPYVANSKGGQLTIALMVNLLARMKSVVSNVNIALPNDISRHDIVPLQGSNLKSGLIQLIDSLTGSESEYSVNFDFRGQMTEPSVTVALGAIPENSSRPDITVEANGWTAYINAAYHLSDWDAFVPVGFHAAATLAVGEIFKHLLLLNFPEETSKLQFRLLNNVSFSTISYGEDPALFQPPHVHGNVLLNNIAIVGTGACGSTALYTLGCFPHLAGELTLIDPGNHKKSNLNRYLLSNYNDCHNGTHKVEVARTFLKNRHPLINVHPEYLPYADVNNRKFRLVVSTVDTIEARWDIQRDNPPIILDTAVTGETYGVLRVYPGVGLCLGCKHGYDYNAPMKRRAKMWGKSFDEMRKLTLNDTPVCQEDIQRLAEVQGHNVERYIDLLGIPFSNVPSITECGDTRFNLEVPNQVATIPFVTTMAGILVAAEIIKEQYSPESQLNNWFDHNMLFVPKPSRNKFLPRKDDCQYCVPAK